MKILLILSLSLGVYAAENLTGLVNLFIGTASGANGGSGGNGFPGAAVPHAMAKVGIDVDTSPRQAGYIADNSSITGISLMHDEGTGGNTNGGYGIFPLFPLTDCQFSSCPVSIDTRKVKRAAGTDGEFPQLYGSAATKSHSSSAEASPGYFTTSFINGIKLETTSTRRAGFIRTTFPNSNTTNHLVVDLTNDLQRSFSGGALSMNLLNSENISIQLQGTFLQSYGTDNYTAFGCYTFDTPVSEFGTFTSNTSTSATLTVNSTSLSFPFTSTPSSTRAGALLSFANAETVTAKFGVSFISADQACFNLEEEVPEWDFDRVRAVSEAAWEDVLQRVQVNIEQENSTISELLYSSLYRASLVPANMTGENPYWTSNAPFYDALFCSWDTFRTVHPLLSITSPKESGEVVSSYVDGWRNTGFIPECRANTKAGYVQGGSDGMPILGDFAVKYGNISTELGVSADDLYQALVDTAENTPPDWYRVGRQNTAWKMFGYIPTDWPDPSSTGLPTREASRALEYALGDFAVRQAAVALGKSDADVEKYANRSMNFLNHWDPSVSSDGFQGFAQRRFPNGTFAFSDPVACSPIDTVGHSCARGTDNDVGFYESSSWEMSFFAPHSMASIVELMGGPSTFLNRTEHYFSKGYFQAGNEPSFAIPWAYHYADRPDMTAQRVRDVVFKNFGTGISGLPGNDDSGAMAALLTFHLLGLYPVSASNQLLVGSPFVSSFTIRNDLGHSTSFEVVNFDSATLQAAPPDGSRLYVANVTVNGVQQSSRCVLDFRQVFMQVNASVILEMTADRSSAMGCGEGGLPDSLSTQGFS